MSARRLTAMALVAVTVALPRPAEACTSFRIRTQDGLSYYARTFESEVAGYTVRDRQTGGAVTLRATAAARP